MSNQAGGFGTSKSVGMALGLSLIMSCNGNATQTDFFQSGTKFQKNKNY